MCTRYGCGSSSFCSCASDSRNVPPPRSLLRHMRRDPATATSALRHIGQLRVNPNWADPDFVRQVRGEDVEGVAL